MILMDDLVEVRELLCKVCERLGPVEQKLRILPRRANVLHARPLLLFVLLVPELLGSGVALELGSVEVNVQIAVFALVLVLQAY